LHEKLSLVKFKVLQGRNKWRKDGFITAS